MTTHTIHALSFDLSIDTKDSDSARYARWIQSMLLPIIDEVIEQQAQQAKIEKHQIARIQRLELDLGDVSLEMSEVEIARRLRAQLSTALFEQLDLNQSQVSNATSELEVTSGLLHFLKTGQISWEQSSNSKYALKKLIQDAIASPQLTDLLNALRQHPQHLLRLVRQCDSSDLYLLYSKSIRTWPAAEKELCLDWLSLEMSVHAQDLGYLENLWLYLIQQSQSLNASLRELSNTWYQQMGQETNTTILGYQSKLKTQYQNGHIAHLSEEKCEETLQKLRSHLTIEPSYTSRAQNSLEKIGTESLPSISTIEDALKTGELARLRDHWQAILNFLPHTVQRLHHDFWPIWVRKLDTRSGLELLRVLQVQCSWFFKELIEVSGSPELDQELSTVVEFALAWEVGKLSSEQLVKFWEECAQSARHSAALRKQLRTYSPRLADAHSPQNSLENLESPLRTSDQNLEEIEEEYTKFMHSFLQANTADEVRSVLSSISTSQKAKMWKAINLSTLLKKLELLHPRSAAFLHDFIAHQAKLIVVLLRLQSVAKSSATLIPALDTELGMMSLLRKVGIEQLANDTEAKDFAIGIIATLGGSYQIEAEKVSTLSQELDAVQSSIAATHLREALSDDNHKNSTLAKLLAAEANRPALALAVSRLQVNEDEQLTAAVHIEKILAWSSTLAPHLQALLTDLFSSAHLIAPILQMKQQAFVNLAWKTVLKEHTQFISAQRFLQSILRHSVTNQLQESQLAKKIAETLTIPSEQFSQAISSLIASSKPVESSNATSEKARAALSRIQQYQQSSRSERLSFLAQQSVEQQISIVQAIHPSFARIARELLQHTKLVQTWLSASLPSFSISEEELHQALLKYFAALEPEESANTNEAALLRSIFAAIATTTHHNAAELEAAFSRKLLQYQAKHPLQNQTQRQMEQMQQGLPTVVRLMRHQSFKKMKTSPTSTTISVPSLLANFRDWQRGRIRLQDLEIALGDLQQMFQWWLTHATSLSAELKTLYLEKTFTFSEQSVSPSAFLIAILDEVRLRPNLNLTELEELLAWHLHRQSLQAARVNGNNLSADHEIGSLDFLLDEDLNTTQIETLGAQNHEDVAQHLLDASDPWPDLKQKVNTLLQGADPTSHDIRYLHHLLSLCSERSMQDLQNARAFMQSVEFYTINASNPRIFLFATLRKLVSDKEIDLEDLLHQNHRLARASMGRDANGSEPYGVTVIKLLEKVGAIANSNSLAQQRVASWQTFLQKTAISSFVQMYLRHFFLQAHTGVITGDQQQAFSQTLQKIFDATHVEQILFLVQGVIQQEERQGREVFASILQAQFGIAPEMIKGIDTNYFDNAEIQEIGEHLQTLLTQSLLENSLREELQFRETESIARNDGSVASITKQSPLPKGWRDALPQVLAEAFLSGSLNKLDVLWTELNTYHRQDLLQAQKRYLHLAQLRDRLLQSESHEKILDLISTFSPSLKLLLLEIRTHQARLVQLWHLKMSHDQLFSSLLRNSYHLLFSAQLEQKTAAQQLQQILQSMPFWPQQLSTQQRHLRAFYYDLIDEPESLLSNCLRTLYQKERIGLMAAQHSQPIDLELNAATYAEGADAWRSDSSPALLSDDMLSDACLDEMSVNGNSFYDQLDCLDAALSSSNEQAALANLIEGLSTSVLAQSSNETRAKIWQQTAESLYEGRHQVSAERPNLEQAQWLLGTQVLAHSLHAHHADVLLPRESHKTNRNTEPTDNKSETSIERLIVLLHSAAPLQHTESVWMRLQIMNLITRPSPDILTLAPSLNSNTVLRKMTTILDSVDLEHLYRRLHPQLHTQLHVLCRAIEKTKQLSLHDADNFLEASSWFAIYQASKKSTGENIRSFTLALLSAIQRQHQASESDQAGQLLDPNRGLQDLVAYARDQKREAERARLANEEAKKKTLDTLKKKARLLGEEEEIPYGESNVSNAGMVIIAPYIQRLFNLLELTRDGAFITEEAAERAVHLLQYVVTAEQSTPEYQLALNKLLCGIHGGVPIVAGINISEHEKTVIEQMLMGVISHWSALGKTSISGLRQTFLAREGQLSFVDENWQLRIPSSSFDMLLDRLPWSFAMIKFPWMRAPLHVTWR